MINIDRDTYDQLSADIQEASDRFIKASAEAKKWADRMDSLTAIRDAVTPPITPPPAPGTFMGKVN